MIWLHETVLLSKLTGYKINDQMAVPSKGWDAFFPTVCRLALKTMKSPMQ